MRRWSMGKVLLLLVAANLLLGVALFSLRSPTRVASEESGPRPALPAPMAQLQARINEGRHGEPFTLILSDADLTAAVGYFLAARPDAPFGKVRVAVTGRGVVLDAVSRGMAVALPVRITGTAGARDGKPWARVEDVSLGDTQVPAFLRDQIVRQANAALDLSRYDLAVTVDTVEFRPGAMTARGAIK